jgi:hypothetical protein
VVHGLAGKFAFEHRPFADPFLGTLAEAAPEMLLPLKKLFTDVIPAINEGFKDTFQLAIQRVSAGAMFTRHRDFPLGSGRLGL